MNIRHLLVTGTLTALLGLGSAALADGATSSLSMMHSDNPDTAPRQRPDTLPPASRSRPNGPMGRQDMTNGWGNHPGGPGSMMRGPGMMNGWDNRR